MTTAKRSVSAQSKVLPTVAVKPHCPVWCPPGLRTLWLRPSSAAFPDPYSCRFCPRAGFLRAFPCVFRSGSRPLCLQFKYSQHLPQAHCSRKSPVLFLVEKLLHNGFIFLASTMLPSTLIGLMLVAADLIKLVLRIIFSQQSSTPGQKPLL